MNQKATIHSTYRLQLGGMAVFIMFWSVWFLYDGFWGYPLQRQIAREFAVYKEQGRSDAWKAYADSQGWPDGTEGNPGHDYSDWDIRTQKMLGFGLLPLSLLYGLAFARSFSKWIALDNDGLATSWGQRVPYAAVTSLNKTRWRKKGIAVVQYQDGAATKRLVLDNFKYARDPIDAMVAAIEERVGPEQIVGDAARA